MLLLKRLATASRLRFTELCRERLLLRRRGLAGVVCSELTSLLRPRRVS